jgi:hypothetical protein
MQTLKYKDKPDLINICVTKACKALDVENCINLERIEGEASGLKSLRLVNLPKLKHIPERSAEAMNVCIRECGNLTYNGYIVGEVDPESLLAYKRTAEALIRLVEGRS